MLLFVGLYLYYIVPKEADGKDVTVLMCRTNYLIPHSRMAWWLDSTLGSLGLGGIVR